VRIGGVDGVPTGWVVCVLTGEGRAREVSWSVVPDAAAVLDVTVGCDAVGVDIPLALPAGAMRRDAEVLAAARLGPARSSLFPTPPAPVLAATSYAEACAAAQAVTGRKISLQSWYIVPKIREFQAVALPPTVVEAHPELTFRTMAPRVAFASKKTARGAGQRIAALAEWADPARLLGDLPGAARIDDVLDALATAWTAQRVATGTAEFLGPGTDGRGRSMAIAV
jgi:predicted RNase H-like nuclease